MKQSLPNGTVIIFNHRDLIEEWKELDPDFDVEARNNTKATIDCLTTYTELGTLDYEFYDIKFEDGYEAIGISGYHFTHEVVHGRRIVLEHED